MKHSALLISIITATTSLLNGIDEMRCSPVEDCGADQVYLPEDLREKLDIAARKNDVATIQTLLESNPELQDKYFLDHIITIAIESNHPRLLQFLFTKGVSANGVDEANFDYPFFLTAVERNTYDCVKLFLEQGANPNMTYDHRVHDEQEYDDGDYADDNGSDDDSDSDGNEDFGPLTRDNYKLYGAQEMDRQYRAEAPGKEAARISSPLLCAANAKNIHILELLIAFNADPTEVEAFNYNFLPWAQNAKVKNFIDNARSPALLPELREECKRWHCGIRSLWAGAVLRATNARP